VSVAGDETTGRFRPDDVRPTPERCLTTDVIEQLTSAPGLSATASDVLDELGYSLAVPGSILRSRSAVGRSVVGHVLTLRYVPERRRGAANQEAGEDSHLAHHVVFELARPGDVVVVEASGQGSFSVFGGMAALAASRAGIAGCIVDGGIRDQADIEGLGVPVWSRELTPVTGKWRMTAESVNAPICCGGVQVRAGDVVLADTTGVCFLPPEVAETAAERILRICGQEANEMSSKGGRTR
jgi:regulator of RNase E activity RraA